MSVNISSSSNDSLLHPQFSDIVTFGICFITPPSSFIFTSFFMTNILLFLPLSIFILYLVFQRRCRQSSTSTATTTTSHSDIFTYHLVAIEMIGIFGIVFCFCGISGENYYVILVGFCFWSLSWYGEILFNLLTCVERYLAVVHPITYLSLRGERGIRVRNISTGCVWLFSIGGQCLIILGHVSQIVDFCVFVSSLVVTSFCSISALCVLIRPGPGEQGGDRKKVDQSKKRAFYTIVAILGVLLLRFVWNIISVLFYVSGAMSDCLMISMVAWFNLPSSLVLPLLFLHRAGTFVCCKTNTK